MKKYLCLLLVTIYLPAMAQHETTSTGNAVQVKTNNGLLEGTTEKSGVVSFKGIPFAAPPIGDLRWREPQPAKNWQGILKADHFGSRAMQTNVFGDMNFRSNGVSEDCLYLNVWAPARHGRELLPVLVYFYGGGFVAGDGSEPRYDGESMATKGIVAITVNYRLGVFGFFTHPWLSKESPQHGSGNYGLMDQAAALKWVQQNIAAFGGDPTRVTIAGESAGSVSVSALMASPQAKNLFAAAIGESGSILGALPPVTLSEAEQTGERFVQTTGVHSLSELRALPGDSILKAAAAFGHFRFTRTLDGYFFPKSLYEIFEKGEQAHVPLLVGWNSEEMNSRAILGEDRPTKENFEKAIKKLYGDQATEVLRVYNSATDEGIEKVATELASDRFIAYSTWKWADLQSKTGGKPVYRYLYERARPAMRPEMGNASAGLAGGVQRGNNPPAPAAKGAVHSAEIEYAMGNLSSNKVFAWTDDDYQVSRTMQAYFVNFIKNANPNAAGLPAWPAANSGTEVQVMHINVQSGAQPERTRERYLLLDKSAKR